MLTRLYIDNFRCFEKFEWKPGRKQLIIGRNGTGKTSLMDAIRVPRQLAARGGRAGTWFKAEDGTLWRQRTDGTFELEARIGADCFCYRLVIGPWGDPPGMGVQVETLDLNGTRILTFEDGELNAEGQPAGYRLDRRRSALSTIAADSGLTDVIRFTSWLNRVTLWHLNPFEMASRAEKESTNAGRTMVNFASWYRHLVQARPRENTALLKDLRRAIEGFDQLQLEHVGENVRILHAEFLRNGAPIRVPFASLSDGQRCLICLYAITHFVVAKGGTVIIDEPDNFISLAEIQPWLNRIEEMADEHKGQVILISHRPEILNQWAPSYGVQFIRDGAGPVRVERFKGDPESPLSAAELVARGWDLD